MICRTSLVTSRNQFFELDNHQSRVYINPTLTSWFQKLRTSQCWSKLVLGSSYNQGQRYPPVINLGINTYLLVIKKIKEPILVCNHDSLQI
jgi:hypothetical protein